MDQQEAILALKTLEIPEHIGQVVLVLRDLLGEMAEINNEKLHGAIVGIDLIHKDLVELTKLMREAPIMRVQAVSGNLVGPGGFHVPN